MSHSVRVSEKVYKQLIHAKARLEQNEEKTVSFSEVISHLLDRPTQDVWDKLDAEAKKK